MESISIYNRSRVCVWVQRILNPPVIGSRSGEQPLILRQGVIRVRAASLEDSQEGVVKVSCCFLLLPEKYRLFSPLGTAQRVPSQSQVED